MLSTQLRHTKKANNGRKQARPKFFILFDVKQARTKCIVHTTEKTF